MVSRFGIRWTRIASTKLSRAAGTFQDRLVTELCLAGAQTIGQANAVLHDFLPRYNAQFAVPAELPESSPDAVLSSIAGRWQCNTGRPETLRVNAGWLEGSSACRTKSPAGRVIRCG